MTVGQSDAAAMLADLGEDVTIGAVTAKGLYRRPGMKVLEQSGMYTVIKDPHVVLERGAFPALAQAAEVEIGGESFSVSDVLDLPDPRFVKVGLRNEGSS